MQRWAAEREAALNAQRHVEAAARVEAAAAEAVLRVTEAELDFLADARQVSVTGCDLMPGSVGGCKSVPCCAVLSHAVLSHAVPCCAVHAVLRCSIRCRAALS